MNPYETWSGAVVPELAMWRDTVLLASPKSPGEHLDVHLAIADGLVRQRPSWLVLDQGDQHRLARLRRPDDRRRFLTGRAMVTALTYEVEGPRTAAWTWHVPSGSGTTKPRWVGPDRIPSVSISHAGDAVVVTLCQGADVGVDVESRAAIASLETAVWEGLACTEELEALGLDRSGSGALSDEALQSAATLFTSKEAILKAIGWGFGVDPRTLHVADGKVVAFNADQARPITLAALPLPESLSASYIGHIAIAG